MSPPARTEIQTLSLNWLWRWIVSAYQTRLTDNVIPCPCCSADEGRSVLAVAPSQVCSPRKISVWLWLDEPHGYSCAPGDGSLNSHAALPDKRVSILTRVRGDVSVASLRRLSVAVALSSPQADTQILSRISLAQRLMGHQYQVQCDTEASVCAPSSQLLSTVSRPSVTKCHAVTPVLEHYPQRIYDLNEPTSFLLSINNWAATEGVLSTAIWRGTRVVGFTQRVLRHIGDICLSEYSPGSEIFLSFFFLFVCL